MNLEEKNMQDKYIDRIKNIILKRLGKYPEVKVIFFGSRAKGKKIFKSSDVDIALEGNFKEIDVSYLKDELKEAPIPYEVDIVNLNSADEKFKKKVYKEGIFWKK